MDTIIYLSYTSKDEQEDSPNCSYVLKDHMIQDYRLIKVYVQEQNLGLDVSQSSLSKRLRYRRSRRMQLRAQNDMNLRLRQELASCLKDRDEVYLCYDESVGGDSWIRQILPFSEFAEYQEYPWVQRLFPEVTCHHFVVFGDSSCVQKVLWELAPRMKSLLWVAPDIEVREVLEDFAEEFYLENGLVINLQYLSPGTTYGQFRIPERRFLEPVTILDFTKNKQIPCFYPPKGSIWLDMASVLEKERRIRARGMCCNLISLRKQWKNAPFA